MKSKNIVPRGLKALSTILLTASSVTAATKVWDGEAATLNWGDGNNWNTNGTPASNDTIQFNGGIAANATVNVNVNTFAASVGTTSLTLNNGAGFTLDFTPGNAYNYIPTVSVGDANTYTITGTSGNSFAFPLTSQATQAFNIAAGGKLKFSGTFVVAGYGATNINKTGAGELDLSGAAFAGGSINQVNVTGGGLRVKTGTTLLTCNGNNLSVYGTPGSSVVSAQSRNITATGTLTLDGVTLTNDALATTWAATTATVHLTNGGGLDIRGQSNVSIDKLTGTGKVYNSHNSATFTVGANGGSSTFDGVIYGSAGGAGGAQNYGLYNGNAGTLGLTKTGGGTLTLTNTSVYTGATLVSAGTLLVNGALGNTAVTVSNTAIIGGTGSIGGTLSFGGNSFLDVVNLADALAVTGNVTFGSGFGIDNLTGINWDSLNLNTPYTILAGANISTANLDNFGIANAAPVGTGRYAYFQNGSLNLVVIPEPSAALLGGLGMLALLRRRRN